MKYFLALVIPLLALPALAHHPGDLTPAQHIGEHLLFYTFLAAVGFVAYCVYRLLEPKRTTPQPYFKTSRTGVANAA